MNITKITIDVEKVIASVVVAVCIASCAALPTRPGGALYRSILDWQKIARDHPDYPRAQENIRTAEKSLSDEIKTNVNSAREAIRKGDLDEAARLYRDAAFMDPRRSDVQETLERHETAIVLVRKHEAERDRAAKEEDWPSVARQDRIILTIVPDYGPAVTNLKKTTAATKESSNESYEKGRRLQDSKDIIGAERAFLTALYFDPSHQEALGFFWSSRTADDMPAPSPDDCIVHVIKPGESMSMLAEHYYGDKYKFPIIALFNNISDATKIQVGQEIKIPRLQSQRGGRNTSQTTGNGAYDYTYSFLEQAKSFLKENAYDESIEEAKKVLAGDPENSEARNILIEAYYQQGNEFLRKNLFEQSLYYLGKVRELVPDYRDIKELFDTAHAGLKAFIDELYKEGIRLYREQLLPKALEKWEQVLKLDPGHEGAKKYSEKARQLIEKLKEMDRK